MARGESRPGAECGRGSREAEFRPVAEGGAGLREAEFRPVAECGRGIPNSGLVRVARPTRDAELPRAHLKRGRALFCTAFKLISPCLPRLLNSSSALRHGSRSRTSPPSPESEFLFRAPPRVDSRPSPLTPNPEFLFRSPRRGEGTFPYTKPLSSRTKHPVPPDCKAFPQIRCFSQRVAHAARPDRNLG